MPEALLAAVFGLLIGSFLNVCIYRMPRDLSVMTPRSFCPSCEKTVAWYDNIPAISYLLLRGRCRYCHTDISLRYPVVEIVTGVLFFTAVAKFGLSLSALKLCSFSAIMVALIFMDFEERILADEFTKGGTVLGLILSWFVLLPPGLIAFFLPPDLSPQVVSLAEAAFAAVVISGMLWLIGETYRRIRSREGLGFGDVKMVACMGAFLGLGQTLMALILGSVMGSVTGVLYIWLNRKDAATYELPFGSFLGIAALVMAFGG